MPDPRAVVTRRRYLFAALNGATLLAGLTALVAVLSRGGLSLAEAAIVFGFVLTMPYTVVGFWNAAIGLWLRHRRPATLAAMPGVAELRGDIAVAGPAVDTAIVMTLRNEAPAPVFDRLARMRESLAASGHGARFTFVVLSDTSEPALLAAEREAMQVFREQAAPDEPEPIFRHRANNAGYKAGNIAEFLDAHGRHYRYFLPLDADSIMAGEVILRMVATLERYPEIGILQSLVVGMPSASGFTRLFQFGMRHAMRAFTTGAVWWTADCGGYWGHNALIRTAPFQAHCRLAKLSGGPPLGGDILSHDQLEAAYMLRAGYEVRVVPVETASYEINPPTLLDFIRRELRWCQGNMQYLRLLNTPGLLPVSRFQLVQAIGMYIAPAAWLGMTAAACIGAVQGDFNMRYLALGVALFVSVFLLAIAPKLAGALDVALSEQGCTRYGGRRLFALSVGCELVSSTLIAPIVAVSITLFLIGLAFGRHVAWGGQNRDRLGIAWRDAFAPLAPHTLLGLGIGLVFWWAGGFASALWAMPIACGLALAVPYTVWSARPSVGTHMARRRLCLIPEERQRPSILS